MRDTPADCATFAGLAADDDPIELMREILLELRGAVRFEGAESAVSRDDVDGVPRCESLSEGALAALVDWRSLVLKAGLACLLLADCTLRVVLALPAALP